MDIKLTLETASLGSWDSTTKVEIELVDDLVSILNYKFYKDDFMKILKIMESAGEIE